MRPNKVRARRDRTILQNNYDDYNDISDDDEKMEQSEDSYDYWSSRDQHGSSAQRDKKNEGVIKRQSKTTNVEQMMREVAHVYGHLFFKIGDTWKNEKVTTESRKRAEDDMARRGMELRLVNGDSDGCHWRRRVWSKWKTRALNNHQSRTDAGLGRETEAEWEKMILDLVLHRDYSLAMRDPYYEVMAQATSAVRPQSSLLRSSPQHRTSFQQDSPLSEVKVESEVVVVYPHTNLLPQCFSQVTPNGLEKTIREMTRDPPVATLAYADTSMSQQNAKSTSSQSSSSKEMTNADIERQLMIADLKKKQLENGVAALKLAKEAKESGFHIDPNFLEKFFQ